MAVTEKKYHVGLGPGDVGDYVLVPGDPFRTPVIAKHLDDSREVAFSREYRTFTGKVDGVPVSTMSTGMGGPSVAIGVEELHELGVHTLLRVGTCGASQPEIKMGDLVIAIGSVRSEGTPDGYVPKEYPAIASLDVVNALVDASSAAGAPYHVGVIRSVDALYSDLMPDRMPRPHHLREELEMWSRAGVISNDMETSTLFVVARLLYEATADLPTRPGKVRTPLREADTLMIGREVVAIPVLRAGLGLLAPVLELLPRVSVGYIGLERDEETAVARIYYNKLPKLKGKVPLLLDPMLATGGSAAQALERITEAGGRDTG